MDLQSLKRRFGLIGNSDGFVRALDVAVRVAPTDLTVLITGESGVGKEVFSKIIHEFSPRKHNPFIAVNCGAIPEGTMDSELFGHEKGAFTGAVGSRKGYFEEVNNGTIFLDEIGEMPISTQARLLRVLESGEFIKVGSSKTQKTNVRVVAATNVHLQKAVQEGRFREDLYYRLNTVPVVVPPLRERKEDIMLLFRKFSADIAEKNNIRPKRLDDEAKNLLLSYRYPGNIRELKNIAEQLTILSEEQMISAYELSRYIPKFDPTNRFLPAIASNHNRSGDFSERDIMYKLLFDMRRDITDLKRFIATMIEKGEISSEFAQSDVLKEVTNDNFEPSTTTTIITPENTIPTTPVSSSTPLIINHPNSKNINDESRAEVVEESLNIADMEKELIIKALKKYKGKRKLAASDLGISERTLYRKLKEYSIEE